MESPKPVEYASGKASLGSDGLIDLTIFGVHTFEDNVKLFAFLHAASAFRRGQKQPVLIRVNMREMVRADFRARQNTYKQSLTFDLDCLCYVGGKNGAGKELLKLALRMFDPNRFHYFESMDEARDWLLDYKKRKLSKDRAVKL
jgi:hypothetical protein